MLPRGHTTDVQNFRDFRRQESNFPQLQFADPTTRENPDKDKLIRKLFKHLELVGDIVAGALSWASSCASRCIYWGMRT